MESALARDDCSAVQCSENLQKGRPTAVGEADSPPTGSDGSGMGSGAVFVALTMALTAAGGLVLYVQDLYS